MKINHLVLASLICLSSFAIAGEKSISDKQIFYGCQDRQYFERLLDYQSQQDTAAFKQHFLEGMMSGQCTDFQAGQKVFLTDTAILSGLVKIRPKGIPAEYWTYMEAVQ